MIILGLDPGTALLGWGVVDTGEKHRLEEMKPLGYGVISTDKSMSDSKRLLAIAQGLRQLISTYQPEHVAVERLFYSKNQKTVMTVSQARGVILLAIEEAGASLLEFTPQEIKLAVTGYGGADKTQMQRMVQLLLKLSEIPKPDDAADALGIAITGAQLLVQQVRMGGR